MTQDQSDCFQVFIMGWYQCTSPPSVEDVLDTFSIFYIALKLGRRTYSDEMPTSNVDHSLIQLHVNVLTITP